MKILVTGGAGFIGSHLCERLLNEGHAVIIVDDLNDFYSPAFKRDNLTSLVRNPRCSFAETDIAAEERVKEVFLDTRPETVIHLAARAGVRPSLEQPFLYERVNVHGTLAVLEASRQAGVKKVLFASSSSVYGAANQLPFREDDYSMMPMSPYAATKIAAEKICYTYSHLYGLSTVCLRFFTVYGPRQRPDLAIRKFTEIIDRGDLIPVFGDGCTGRDYTFIDDIIEGIVAALNFDCGYEIFNLGNSHPIRLHRMIDAIEHALGKKAVLKRLPSQPGDMPITFADISKANRLLGYVPRVEFSDGIEKFVQWHCGRPKQFKVPKAC